MLLGAPGLYIPMTSRAALVVLSLCAFFAPCTSAQLRVGNLTHVLPQCKTACDAYDVMNTGCNAVGVYEITYIYCECTPTNFKIIEDCFNCQAVNATQTQTMQALLNDIVNNCNDKATAPDSTLSIEPHTIVPSSASSANAAHHTIFRPTLGIEDWHPGIGVPIAAMAGVLLWWRIC